jgi:hypothetical protein
MGLLITAVILPELRADSRAYRHDYAGDDTDWWTDGHMQMPHYGDDNVQTRDPDAGNFRFAGVDIGEDAFEGAASEYGTAPIVERGARSGNLRTQVCYVSVQESERIYLAFEESYMNYGAYLFVEGPDWDGRRLCTEVKRSSVALSTSSGLQIGQSLAEVLRILGQSSFRDKTDLWYSFWVRQKKASERELAVIRKKRPWVSEKDIQEEFGTYDLQATIHAHFVDNKLTYLSVSKSETK